MDQLLEGIQIPGRTKKLQILRSRGGEGPLSRSGEWKLIGPTSQDVATLVKNLTVYSGGVRNSAKRFQTLARVIPQMMNCAR